MNDDEVTPEHNSARTGQLLAEIETLRLEMGRARDARVPMQVRDAAPREVFYFAQTVHRKANQLCVELGASSVDAPSAALTGRAAPADVLRVLESARQRVAQARLHLRLEGDAPAADLPGPLWPDAGKTSSDVLAGCLAASRQLNVMIATAFASRDAYEVLTQCLAISERLLALQGAAFPPPPPFERRKFPRDVFQVLWETCQTFYRALLGWGVKVVEVERGFVGEEPTDVYDLATLLLSELDYVASFLPIKPVPRAAGPAPLPVLPSHNYQRARQLQTAIGALAQAVQARSDWLRVAQVVEAFRK
jgi:hypothetical protein